MIVLNVWSLSTMRVNGPKDSLTTRTNQPHDIVQLSHALGKGRITARVRACVRGRGGALLSLIGMFTNLSNANIKVSSWLLKGNV